MKTRNFFASANTNTGFINYFDNILTKNKIGFRYVIKGGSGTGKSTLMKKIGEYFSQNGYTIENYYCSSDPNSLDGVKIVEANICIVDGTSPHVTEANVPMVKDKIINLGEFIGESVFEHRNRIEEILSAKKKLYAEVYRYLSACGELFSNNLSVYSNEKQDYVSIITDVLTKYRLTKQEKTPVNELFITAPDVNGIKSFVAENNYKTITEIPLNEYYFYKFISELKNKLYGMGYTLTEFKNPLIATAPYALFVKETDELFIMQTNNSPNNTTVRNNRIIKDIIELCGENLVKIKKLHFELEKYYVESLDFNGLNRQFDLTIKDIEKKILLLKNTK